MTKWIRADHAQAEKEAAVAAAYEDAADEVGQHLSTPEDVVWAKDAAERIRARTDTDALAARDARVRAEALKEAAEVAGMTRAPMQDTQHEAVGLPPIGDQIAKAILALIPTDQEGDQ